MSSIFLFLFYSQEKTEDIYENCLETISQRRGHNQLHHYNPRTHWYEMQSKNLKGNCKMEASIWSWQMCETALLFIETTIFSGIQTYDKEKLFFSHPLSKVLSFWIYNFFVFFIFFYIQLLNSFLNKCTVSNTGVKYLSL